MLVTTKTYTYPNRPTLVVTCFTTRYDEHREVPHRLSEPPLVQYPLSTFLDDCS